MLYFFNRLKEPEKEILTVGDYKGDKSKFIIKTNEIFKHFLNNCSWFVYLIAGCLILLCIYYYVYDCRRRLNLRRHRQSLQRENRTQQKRRPGAIYRDHQVFRNALKKVHQYISPNELQGGSSGKSYTLKKTRSGRIYGSF